MEYVQSEKRETWVNRLDIRTKMLLLLCTSLLGMLLEQKTIMLALYIVALVFMLGARLSFGKWQALLTISLLTVWGTMWTQAIFYNAHPQTPLFYLVPPGVVDIDTFLIGGMWDGVPIIYEGMQHGVVQSLRLITPLTIGLLIFWTEDPMRMLNGLQKMKLPYPIAFMVMTCLRFIPIAFQEAKITLDAQRLRYYKPFTFWGVVTGIGLYKTIKLVMVPLLANCVRKATHMARSAEGRGFRALSTRTTLKPLLFSKIDYLFSSCILLLTVSIVFCKFITYLFYIGLYEHEHLLPIYWFTAQYL